MYGATEILADSRRHDFLADAARERLAKEARPTQPFASQTRDSLGNAMQTVRAAARGIWVGFFARTVGSSDNARSKVVLTPAR
jgi:hypothetical protein